MVKKRSMLRVFTVGLFLILVIVLVALYLLRSVGFTHGNTPVIRVSNHDIGGNMRIVIMRDVFSDAPARGYYYRIERSGDSDSDITRIDAPVEEQGLNLIGDSTAGIYAIVPEHQPTQVLVIFDAVNGIAWPLPDDSNDYARALSRGRDLVRRLSEHMRVNLVLSDDVRGAIGVPPQREGKDSAVQ